MVKSITMQLLLLFAVVFLLRGLPIVTLALEFFVFVPNFLHTVSVLTQICKILATPPVADTD